MNISFHSADNVPEDVLGFWRERQLARDRFVILTRTFEWFRMMATSYASDSAVAAIRDDANACRAVFPIISDNSSLHYRLLGRTWKTLNLRLVRVFGGDLIEDGSTPVDLAPLWGRIAERFPGTDVVCFDHVADRERAEKLRESAELSSGYFMHFWFRNRPHYNLVLPASFEECNSLRGSKSLKKIRHHERRIEEACKGPCMLKEFRTPEEWASSRAEIEKLMNSAWQAQLLGHRFAMDVAAGPASHGWVRAFLLKVGDHPLAFVLCYQGFDSMIREQSGYNREYAQYYPGEILLHRMLEHLYRSNPPRLLDYGVGEGYQKRMFSNEKLSVDGIMMVRAESGLRMSLKAHAFVERMDAFCRSWLEKVGIKRRIVSWIKRRAGR